MVNKRHNTEREPKTNGTVHRKWTKATSQQDHASNARSTGKGAKASARPQNGKKTVYKCTQGVQFDVHNVPRSVKTHSDFFVDLSPSLHRLNPQKHIRTEPWLRSPGNLLVSITNKSYCKAHNQANCHWRQPANTLALKKCSPTRMCTQSGVCT
jgi:hypothetical protein